jgi:hypothetical protein
MQVLAQPPAEQTFGAGQTTPQPPQFFGSFPTYTHVPPQFA